MKKVAVIGTGMTKFGQLWSHDLKSLAASAIKSAIDDSGIERTSVGVMYIGTMSSGLFSQQEHLGSLLPDNVGVPGIPAIRVEAACASGGLALRQAYIDLALGLHDIAIVVGVEKMSDVGGFSVTQALSSAADFQKEGFLGATFPGIYAMIARLHMNVFGTTEQQLAAVSVKNHKNA